MRNPFRREPLGLPIPDYRPAPPVAVYQTESAFTQLKIIRTHMAAQADELNNLRNAVEQTHNHLRAQTGLLTSIIDRLKKGESDQ